MFLHIRAAPRLAWRTPVLTVRRLLETHVGPISGCGFSSGRIALEQRYDAFDVALWVSFHTHIPSFVQHPAPAVAIFLEDRTGATL
jgi:hypothetical protein